MELICLEYQYARYIEAKYDLPILRVNAPYRFYGDSAANIVIYDVDQNTIIANPIITKREDIEKAMRGLEELIRDSDTVIKTGKIFAIDFVSKLFVSNLTTRTSYSFFSRYIPPKAEYVLAIGKDNSLVRLSTTGSKIPQILAYEELSKGFLKPIPENKQTTKLARLIYNEMHSITNAAYYTDQTREFPNRLMISEFKTKGISFRAAEIRDKTHVDEPLEMEDGRYSLLDLTQVKVLPDVDKDIELSIDFIDDSVGIHSGILASKNNINGTCIILTVDNIPNIRWVVDNFATDKVRFYTYNAEAK